jgi:hypothetical protein
MRPSIDIAARAAAEEILQLWWVDDNVDRGTGYRWKTEILAQLIAKHVAAAALLP